MEILKVFLVLCTRGATQGMWLLRRFLLQGITLCCWFRAGMYHPVPAGVRTSFCQFFQESISCGQTWLAGLPDASTGILSFHQ